MKSLLIKIVIFPLCLVILSWAYFTPCFGQGQKGKYGFGIKDIISTEGITGIEGIVINGRYWSSEKSSIDGNFGFRYFDPDEGEDSKVFLIGAGINQYLSPQETFSPFVGVDFSILVIDPGAGDSSTTFGLDGKFGGEYFFTQRFSLSGEVLLGFRFGDDTEIGTDGRLGVLYYLN